MGTLIFIPFMLLFAATAGFAPKGEGAPSSGVILGISVGLIFAAPILYSTMGFITGLIGAFIYNIVAKWIGGIEIEVE